ncbi:Nuclear factor related to kappa-B-binding protein [Linum perenne]
MGIQKISHWKSHCSTVSYLVNGSGVKVLDNVVSAPDSGDDSDGEEPIELNCELGTVDGHVCRVPYDLYDLPDLKEILCLDTWNSCLTEDERFHLSAYLPDMDEQTFVVTMKELFDGDNIYFGNPLDTFFRRLKGGLYPPMVADYRECIQFLQSKKHYNLLRSYHDKMVRSFVEMRRLWDQCEKGVGVEERMLLWTERSKLHRDVNLLDLNKYPGDDNLVSEEVPMDRKPLVEAFNMAKFVPPNSKGKGILKKKASGNCSFQTHNVKAVGNDISKQGRSVPKGVLKIVPKQPSGQLEQLDLPRGLNPNILIKSQGLRDVKFSSLPASLHMEEAGGLYNSNYMGQNIENKVSSLLNQPPCLLNQQDDTLRTSSQSGSSIQKIRRGTTPALDERSIMGKSKLFGGHLARVPYNEHHFPMTSVGGSRYAVDGKHLWSELRPETRDFSLDSLRSFPFAVPYHREDQYLMAPRDEQSSAYSTFPETVPRVLNVGKRKPETVVGQPSERMKGKSKGSLKISGNSISRSIVSEGYTNDPALPLTYKRRKAQAKVKSSNFG